MSIIIALKQKRIMSCKMLTIVPGTQHALKRLAIVIIRAKEKNCFCRVLTDRLKKRLGSIIWTMGSKMSLESS